MSVQKETYFRSSASARLAQAVIGDSIFTSTPVKGTGKLCKIHGTVKNDYVDGIL